MGELIDLMQHEHIKIEVIDFESSGVEEVPAMKVGDGVWVLLKSPLYAMGVAAGDWIEPLENERGTFKLVKRGGNVCVQLYLSSEQSACEKSTCRAVTFLERGLRAINGTVDGHALGLISCTVPISVSFNAIEKVFFDAESAFPDSQWQYGNIYDAVSGDPIGWWETNMGI